MPPSSFWCCCFLSHLLGGVAAVLPSRRSFWVVLFSPSHSRQLNGANEWKQVAVKQSEANESEVVHCWGGGVFLPSTFGVAVFSPYIPCHLWGGVFSALLLLYGVFSLLIRLGGARFSPSLPGSPMLGDGVFPPPLFGWRCFPSSVASNLCLLI